MFPEAFIEMKIPQKEKYLFYFLNEKRHLLLWKKTQIKKLNIKVILEVCTMRNDESFNMTNQQRYIVVYVQCMCSQLCTLYSFEFFRNLHLTDYTNRQTNQSSLKCTLCECTSK